jgi:hypothetical protein
MQKKNEPYLSISSLVSYEQFKLIKKRRIREFLNSTVLLIYEDGAEVK